MMFLLFNTIPRKFVAEGKEETKLEEESFKVVQLMTKMITYYTNH